MVAGVPTKNLCREPEQQAAACGWELRLNGGDWGLWLWRCSPGVDPQPECSVKGATPPGRCPWIQEDPHLERTGARRHRHCGAPGPPSCRATGLCPVCSLGLGHPGLGCSEECARLEGLPYWADGQGALGRRRREEEGLEPGALWSWLDPSHFLTRRWGGNLCFLASHLL